VLTKRPERMRDLLNAYYSVIGSRSVFGLDEPPVEPLPNLWLGVSIENRRFVGRADLLRDTPAAVRFISAEPLLGPLYRPWKWTEGEWCREYWETPELDLDGIDWLIVGGESGPATARSAPSGSATCATPPRAHAAAPRSSSSSGAGGRRRPAGASSTAARGTSCPATGVHPIITLSIFADGVAHGVALAAGLEGEPPERGQ
jgi:hypothetical protein